VLVRRAQTALYDAVEGLQVAELPGAREAVLGADLACALLQDAEVLMYRVGTHLSVV
jgi:hypothetical protein